ncbi:MAG: hypothetical protein JSV03_10400 [Planctomycetota bacterium]|nr:MAG: hypothetical protein JSV03_10400 [Planctomycetota bacterium]
MTETPPAPNRIWLSLIVGCALALPAGWLLATLAVLPMFLGLFFFLLFGLLIGAIMFRFGRAARPAPRSKLIAVGCMASLVVWAVALVTEYRNFPTDAAKAVRDSFPSRSFVKTDLERIRHETHRHVLKQLKEDYSPGGFVGYLRWAATDGTLKCPRIFGQDTATYQLHQRGVMWIIRVVLSLVMVGFTTITQFIGLAESPKSDDQVDENEQ